jgi:hypothetical protein
LDHRVLAIKSQQLFGAALATERPKARAAASGKDHRIEVGTRLHLNTKPNIYAAAGERLDGMMV